MARNLLETDGYKFSMADAGWPLRKETFVFFFRKGGPQVMPFDANKRIMELWPEAGKEEYDYLASQEYEMGVGFKSLFQEKSVRSWEVCALPQWSIFYPGEPIFTFTGASALVSWPEPLVLQLSYEIQLATLALTNPGELARELRVVSCHRHKELALELLDRVNVKAPPIAVDEDGYFARVRKSALELLAVVKDPNRVFEVGLRSAICMAQHSIVLEAIKSVGIRRTSSVAGAKKHGLIPVGTMGHEHPQRYRQDELCYRAMKDRRPYRSSFLTDTFDAFQSGIPAALRVIAEDPQKNDSMRYDSEDKRGEYIYAVSKSKERGLDPIHIIESELDIKETSEFETLRNALRVAEDRQFYGYGKFFVSDTAPGFLTRDKVSAVYKLSQTGPWPTMKFSRHKESLPGKPVVFRRTTGNGPAGIVGQEGERAPDGYRLLSGILPRIGERGILDPDLGRMLNIHEHQDGAYATWSPATQALRDRVKRDVDQIMNAARIDELNR